MTQTEPGSEKRRPGAVYMSLLLVTAERVDFEEIARRHLGLDQGAEYRQLILKRYDCAYGFVFNKFLYNDPCLTHDYLGHQGDLGDDLLGLGRVRVDCVLQTNRFHRTRSLHLHFSFQHGDFDIRDRDPVKISALAAFGRGLWGIEDVELLPARLREFIADVNRASPRKMAFDLSRYVYASVCGQEFDGEWAPYAETLWALLFFQDEGANVDAIRTRLAQASWSGGGLSRNFFQAGGMVSLAGPYPGELYAGHRDWFLPQFNLPQAVPTLDVERADVEYDYLPEFPPLRCVAFPLLEYAGWVEETLRDASSSLLGSSLPPAQRWVDRLVPTLKRFGAWLRLLRRLPRIQNGVYRAQNLDVLRLPVTRPFAESLLEDKQLDVTKEACRDLQAGALNLIVLVLTVVGLVIAVVQLVPFVRDNLLVQLPPGWLL